MPRLIDDIRTAGCFEQPWFIAPDKRDKWGTYAKAVAEIVRDPELPVILIDNVAQYYFTSSDQEQWDLAKDFPNLAPPFDRMWLEHKMPKVIHSKEKGDSDVAAFCPNGRVGMVITALQPKDCIGEGIPANVKWVLWGDLFIDYGQHGGVAQGPHGATFFAVDDQGALIERPWMQTYCGAEFADAMRSYMSWFNPAFLAISFMHCKNVVVQNEVVDKPLAKKYHAKTGNWPVRYKTLVIEPLKQILRTEGRSGEVGIKKAIHICRGHFADYTQGKGLFGKYHGRFWIPATVRGSKSGAEKPPAREIEVKLA